MPHWKLIISGRVQTAGYRALVKNIALGLQVKGVVRNLDDGTVEIFCEAGAESFESFREAINIKSDPKNIFAPSVSEIMVYDASSPEYSTPPGEDFKAFRIDYSGVDPVLETLERSEMGIIALGAVNQNIVAMHSDLKGEMNAGFSGLSREMKTGFSDLKEETKKTHEKLDRIADASVTTHEKLDRIADASVTTHEKLDRIADASVTTHENLDRIADASVTTHEKLDSIDHRLDDALNRYDLFGKEITVIREDIGDLKLLASEFREFKDLFAMYVKHEMSKGSE